MNDRESLDPNDWEELRTVGHRAIDEAIQFLQSLRDRPVWQPTPEDVKDKFRASIPQNGVGLSAVYEQFGNDILPYSMGNPHPRFWAWYMGNSSFGGALGDFLIGLMNSNAGAGNHIGQHIEDQVISWMNEIVGYPESSSGIVVSGGSMANYVGLAVGRHVNSGYDIRKEGVRAAEKQFTVYASTEVHSCNQKAVELLGIGSAYFRKVQVDDEYRIDTKELEKTIQKDIAEGFQPLALIGSAGTVNTGAIDDLERLYEISRTYDLWYHIDGAIGAIAMLSEIAKPQLKGIEKSDSVALDLHKWLHVPFEAGCVLVRDRLSHRNTFILTPEYLEQNTRGIASGSNWYSEYGLQLSRRLRAMKVWMTIKEHGAAKLGRMITKNIHQAHYLENLINESSQLELMAPVGLDIVCYRFVADVPDLNSLNRQILIELHERGFAVPTYTTLQGHYCIRVAIANHRSVNEDFDFLIEKTIEIGEEQLSKGVDLFNSTS